MARVYTVSFSGTLTNTGGDADLLELIPAADKPISLRGLVLSQISETGDAAEEGLRVSIIRLPATVTGGNGTGTTPRPLDETDGAASFTAEVNGATVATTSGTAVTLDEIGWNIRMSPMERWWPDADFAPKVRNAGALVIRCQTTAADDITVQGTAYVSER
jgi:hypothetical protein